jgi:hypothetical protein
MPYGQVVSEVRQPYLAHVTLNPTYRKVLRELLKFLPCVAAQESPRQRLLGGLIGANSNRVEQQFGGKKAKCCPMPSSRAAMHQERQKAAAPQKDPVKIENSQRRLYNIH